MSWGKFYSKEKLGIKYSQTGFLSDYNEGGYPLFLGIETESLESIKKRFKAMQDSSVWFLQTNTNAVNFIFSGYILDMGKIKADF